MSSTGWTLGSHWCTIKRCAFGDGEKSEGVIIIQTPRLKMRRRVRKVRKDWDVYICFKIPFTIADNSGELVRVVSRV